MFQCPLFYDIENVNLKSNKDKCKRAYKLISFYTNECENDSLREWKEMSEFRINISAWKVISNAEYSRDVTIIIVD